MDASPLDGPAHPSASPYVSATAYAPARRKRRPYNALSGFRPATMFALLIIASLLCHANAVLVSTFDNCLKEFSKRSPSQIQFHPILVAAEYDPVATEESYLTITVYGVVTGRNSTTSAGGKSKRDLDSEVLDWGQGTAGLWDAKDGGVGADLDVAEAAGLGDDLGPASATYFGKEYNTKGRWPKDDVWYNFSGEIVDYDPAWKVEGHKKVATTLSTVITMSSFHVTSNKTFLCDDDSHPNSAGAICPMGDLTSWRDKPRGDRPSYKELTDRRLVPAEFRNNVTHLVQELPSFTFRRRLTSNYQFSTLSVLMRLISGDKEATNVGCVRVQLTPVLNTKNALTLTWVPVVVLVIVATSVMMAGMFNPWNGTTDIFKWSSNFGMDEDMLRMVTPGFADCLQWFQFLALSGGLSINYPAFYPAVVSKVAWSALLLNTSFSSSHINGTHDVWRADGLYAQQAWKYGYERLAQMVGLYDTDDIWPCVMVWFAVVLSGSIILFQIFFWGRQAIRRLRRVEEADLSSKNWPFTSGLMCRVAYTYFMVPTFTASAFHLTQSANNHIVTTVLAAVFLAAQMGVLIWLTHVIWTFKPRSALFDELPYLLTFGTFYNTFKEKGLNYFIVCAYTNVLRGIAFGALQPSGVAQLTILAVCEIVTLLTISGIKPFARPTSMNLWHSIFAIIRLITVLLMMTFIYEVSASDAVKGWCAWIILGLHATVLIIAFIIKPIQTLLELVLRGYNSDEEAARGGLAKVAFPMLWNTYVPHKVDIDAELEMARLARAPSPNRDTRLNLDA